MPRTARKNRYAETPDMPNRKNAQKILFMEVGWQGDQGVYVLSSWSKERIQAAYPSATIIPVVLVGMDKSGNYARYHQPHWERIAQMLTGLSPEQIGRLGGIRLFDQEAQKVLWEWHPEARINARSEATPASDCGSLENLSPHTKPLRPETRM